MLPAKSDQQLQYIIAMTYKKNIKKKYQNILQKNLIRKYIPYNAKWYGK